MEQAAREGDIEGLRQLLKEHDLATKKSSFGGSSAVGVNRILVAAGGVTSDKSHGVSAVLWRAVVVYCCWDLLATLNDYRVTHREASALAEAQGGGEVLLHIKARAVRGRVESKALSGAAVTESPKSVWLLPHLYVSDILWLQRTKWTLACTQKPGQTAWSTRPHPDDGPAADAPPPWFEFRGSPRSGGSRGGGSV